MKKNSSHTAAYLWNPFESKANLNVNKNPIIDIGSSESIIFVLICSCNCFAHLDTLFKTWSLRQVVCKDIVLVV